MPVCFWHTTFKTGYNETVFFFSGVELGTTRKLMLLIHQLTVFILVKLAMAGLNFTKTSLRWQGKGDKIFS